MPNKKITFSSKKIVLREARKQPFLGVRGLSDRIARKYSIFISKSAVHNILNSKGVKAKKGPKKASLLYKARSVDDCGLILLRALDYRIGLFDYLTNAFRVYTPKLNQDMLKKLIIIRSFSSFAGENLKEIIKKEGFLRLAGLNYLPIRSLQYFSKILEDQKPVIDLKALKDKIRPISTIKFFFNEGGSGFCDAKMTSIWQSPCEVSNFYLPLNAVKVRLRNMLKNNMIIIGYTKSFDYLNLLVFDFIKGVKSGLKRVEFLDENGKIVYKEDVNKAKVALFIGYNPKALNKGVVFPKKSKRFKRFFWKELGEFFCCNILTKFVQDKAKKEIVLNNILIKKNLLSFPDWGVLSTVALGSKKDILANCIKKYMYLWPNINEDFFRDIGVIQKALKYPNKNRDYFKSILPSKLKFKESLDFAWVGQILSAAFKELIWGWEPKDKKGYFSLDKTCIRVYVKQIPKQVKKSFNREALFIENRRVFIE